MSARRSRVPPTAAKQRIKVKLVKVGVQPIYDVATVSAGAWPDYSGTKPPKADWAAVAVVPVFVLERGGEIIHEWVQDMIMIPREEWGTYSSERFPREVAEFEARINKMPATELAELLRPGS